MFQDISISISKQLRNFVWALGRENTCKFADFKKISYRLFELSCAECFEYESCHAPLSRPFLVSALLHSLLNTPFLTIQIVHKVKRFHNFVNLKIELRIESSHFTIQRSTEWIEGAWWTFSTFCYLHNLCNRDFSSNGNVHRYFYRVFAILREMGWYWNIA